jgi:hypothetical protein
VTLVETLVAQQLLSATNNNLPVKLVKFEKSRNAKTNCIRIAVGHRKAKMNEKANELNVFDRLEEKLIGYKESKKK